MSKTITTGMLTTMIGGIPINCSLPCSPGNFNRCTSRNVSYVVMHYTGNSADTAKANANYFTSSGRGASAHFFVDESTIYQSVWLRDMAWHCGTDGTYYHNACRNFNSVGIEMCTSGSYKVSAKTKENAAQLCAYLCKIFSIGPDNVDAHVLRHWDVTRKSCPAQMVGADNQEWKQFQEHVKEILKGDDDMTADEVRKIIAEEMAKKEKETAAKPVSSWAAEQWNKAVDKGVFDGTAPRGGLTREQEAVVLNRLGLLE